MQWTVIAFITGSMIPLLLLPGAVLSALRFIPFSHVVYTPSMLLTGQMGAMEGLFGFCVLLTGTAAMIMIAQNTYQRMRVQYDGVGI